MSSAKSLLVLAGLIQAVVLFGMCIALAVKYRGMTEAQRRLPMNRQGEILGVGFWLALRILLATTGLTVLALRFVL